LKPKRKTIGALDGRFVGETPDPLEKYTDYDPQSEAISAAFAAAFSTTTTGSSRVRAGQHLSHHQIHHR